MDRIQHFDSYSMLMAKLAYMVCRSTNKDLTNTAELKLDYEIQYIIPRR